MCTPGICQRECDHCLLRTKAAFGRLTMHWRSRKANRQPNGGREPHGAPQRSTIPHSHTRRAVRNAPFGAASEAIGRAKAQRSGHKHRSQAHLLCARLAVRPNLGVVLCQIAVVLLIRMGYHTQGTAQHGAVADAATRPEIGAFLERGFVPTAFPIYWCGAAKRRALGGCRAVVRQTRVLSKPAKPAQPD